MKVRKLVAFSAGTLMLVTNITPILADETYSMDTNTVMRICEDSIDGSSKLINDIIDGIEIEKEEPAAVNNEISSVQQPVIYSYVEQEIPVEQTMSVDEFMALYGSMVDEELQEVTVPVDTSAGQAAYDQALADYNAALAEYEAANQMVETTKEVEVEIIEEVTDEQGNVTQVSHTEIQTVTEMAPAADVETAQVNLNAASAALESARISLEAAQVQTESFLTTVDNTLTDTVVEMKEEPVAIEEDESIVLEELTYANSGTCGDNITWTLDDEGLLTISGTGDMDWYYSYTGGIITPWAREISSIKSVTISSGITNIYHGAFSGCTNLIDISIPDTVKTIGLYAFSGCTGLTSILIPDNVTSIGTEAFYGCTGLTEVIIPSSVTSIGTYAFWGCTGIKSITIPNSVTSVLKNSFQNCTSLTEVILDNVTSIDSKAFKDCTSLTDVIIPESITYIASDAFEGTPFIENKRKEDYVVLGGILFEYQGNDTTITIPSNVKRIRASVFSDHTEITKVTLPTSVTHIEASAFVNCSSLTDVIIPESITYIAGNAFNGTPFIENKKEDYVVLGNVLYKYQGNDTQIIIPSNVKVIGESVFNGHSDITSITIPESVTSIESYAFSGCTGLTGIAIPKSVTSIGSSAFSGCTGLTGITLPEGITSVKSSLFSGCTSLTSITIPESVTEIELYAFKDCTSLTSIVIPNGVTGIPQSAFSNCIALTEITLPECATYIGYSAFSGCTGLISITIPEGVTTIGMIAFSGCTSLTSITIPETVTSIGSSAFWGCTKLEDVYYEGTEKEWNEKKLYEFDDNVTVHFLGIPFKDVPKDAWYYSVAKECYETGLINGTSPTTFSPLQTMTRAMVVTILWRMDGQPKTDFNNKFKDVSSTQWYATSISWAVNNGVVNGYGDGTFKPDAAVTREQVAVMLANYAGYKKVYKPGTKKLNTYPDGSQVSTWAQQGMKWALTNGIISGDGAGYLRPKKSATRAEGAAMLLRMNNWL